MVKLGLFTLLSIASAGSGFAAPRRALLVSTAPLREPAYVDFALQVAVEFSRLNDWQLVPVRDLTTPLPTSQSHSLEVSLVTRQDFLKTLQQGALKHITDLQRTLDTELLDAAVIIDCASNDTSRSSFSSCGLFYYDRVQARVTATAMKRFLVPLYEVKHWGAPLVSNLVLGLAGKAQEDERQQIATLMHAGEGDTEDTGGGSLKAKLAAGVMLLPHQRGKAAGTLAVVWQRESYHILIDATLNEQRPMSAGYHLLLGMGTDKLVSTVIGTRHSLAVGASRFAPTSESEQHGPALRWATEVYYACNNDIDVGIVGAAYYYHEPRSTTRNPVRYGGSLSASATVRF